jgi:signal transduction histidine kinase
MRILKYWVLVIVIFLWLKNDAAAQSARCEQEVAKLEVRDFGSNLRDAIPVLKNYLARKASIVTPDCRRRICYLLAVVYEVTGPQDSAFVYYRKELEAALQTGEDTARAEAYNHIGYYYMRANNTKNALLAADSVYMYAKAFSSKKKPISSLETEAVIINAVDITADSIRSNLPLSFVKNYSGTEKRLYAGYYKLRGTTLGSTEKMAEAEKNLVMAYAFALSNEEDSTEANILNNIAYMYLNKGYFQKATPFLHAALLELEKRKHDESSQPNVLINLCYCYRMVNKLREAEQYGLRAVELSKKGGYNSFLSNSLRTLAWVYIKQKRTGEAEKLLRESNTVAQKLNSKSERAYNNRVLAQMLLEVSNREKEAEQLINESMVLMQQYDTAGLYFVNYTRGYYHYKRKDWKNAVHFLQQSLKQSTFYNDRPEMASTYQLLAEVYKASGDAKTSSHYYTLFKNLSDSTAGREMAYLLTDMESKYMTSSKENEYQKFTAEQKEKELQLIKISGRTKLFLWIALSALLVATVVFYFNRRLALQKKELNKSRQQLEELNSLQNRLFGIIAHDLKSTTIPFQQAGKLLKNYVAENDTKKAIYFTEKLEENSMRLSGTLNNLLWWSLRQMNGFVVNNEYFEDKPVIEDIAALFAGQIEDKQVQLVITNNESNRVFLDQEIYKIILRNLLSNAVKFTANGSVYITAKLEPDYYRLIVKDEGMGMSKEVSSRLFDLDRSGIGQGTAGEKGSGLGLLLIKKLLEQQGGTIYIHSEPGNGTVVQVLFQQTNQAS